MCVDVLQSNVTASDEEARNDVFGVLGDVARPQPYANGRGVRACARGNPGTFNDIFRSNRELDGMRGVVARDLTRQGFYSVPLNEQNCMAEPCTIRLKESVCQLYVNS
jgi:hypothetical protein